MSYEFPSHDPTANWAQQQPLYYAESTDHHSMYVPSAGTVFSLHHYPPPPPPPPPPPSQPMHAQAPGGMQPPFPVQYPLSLPGPSDHPQQRPIYGRPLRAHDDVPFGFSVPGPKRPRTILTGSQRHLFKTTFEQNPKPSRKASVRRQNKRAVLKLRDGGHAISFPSRFLLALLPPLFRFYESPVLPLIFCLLLADERETVAGHGIERSSGPSLVSESTSQGALIVP